MIEVPVSLLLNRKLPPSAKLVWMALSLADPDKRPTVAWLALTTGLTRPTVRSALPLAAGAGHPPGQTVRIPRALLGDRKAGRHAKLLFGVLQATPSPGQTTHAELSHLARLNPKTVRASLKQLAAKGWVKTEQSAITAPIRFTLLNPIRSRQRAELAEVKQRLREAQYKGEAIMKEILNVLVDSREFRDNTTPGYMINPVTDERLEFDRFYPPKVAFEFQGAQHDGPTERFSSRKSIQQQGRDQIKEGICKILGITLVKVYARDLSIQGMLAKVEGLLPLRDLTDCQALIAYLDDSSHRYREKARKGA